MFYYRKSNPKAEGTKSKLNFKKERLSGGALFYFSQTSVIFDGKAMCFVSDAEKIWRFDVKQIVMPRLVIIFLIFVNRARLCYALKVNYA
jgi:hypothetical protein